MTFCQSFNLIHITFIIYNNVRVRWYNLKEQNNGKNELTVNFFLKEKTDGITIIEKWLYKEKENKASFKKTLTEKSNAEIEKLKDEILSLEDQISEYELILKKNEKSETP